MTNKTLAELKEQGKNKQEQAPSNTETQETTQEPKLDQNQTRLAELEQSLAEIDAKLADIVGGKTTFKNYIEQAYATIELDKSRSSIVAQMNVARFDLMRSDVLDKLLAILAEIKPHVHKLIFEEIVSEDGKTTTHMLKFNEEITTIARKGGGGSSSKWTNGKETLSAKDLAMKAPKNVLDNLQGTIARSAWGRVIESAQSQGHLTDYSKVEQEQSKS